MRVTPPTAVGIVAPLWACGGEPPPHYVASKVERADCNVVTVRPAEDIIQPAASSSVWLDCNYWVTVRNDGGEDPALSRMLHLWDPSHQYVI